MAEGQHNKLVDQFVQAYDALVPPSIDQDRATAIQSQLSKQRTKAATLDQITTSIRLGHAKVERLNTVLDHEVERSPQQPAKVAKRRWKCCERNQQIVDDYDELFDRQTRFVRAMANLLCEITKCSRAKKSSVMVGGSLRVFGRFPMTVSGLSRMVGVLMSAGRKGSRKQGRRVLDG